MYDRNFYDIYILIGVVIWYTTEGVKMF